MKRELHIGKIKNRCFYLVDGNKINGCHSGIRGDVSGIRGDVTDIRGDVTDIRGDVTGISGNVSGNVSGDIDLCDITTEDRSKGIDIKDLIKV